MLDDGPRLRNMHLYERIPHDPERFFAVIESRRGLDIGIGNDSGRGSLSTQMTFCFAFLDCGNLELGEYNP